MHGGAASRNRRAGVWEVAPKQPECRALRFRSCCWRRSYNFVRRRYTFQRPYLRSTATRTASSIYLSHPRPGATTPQRPRSAPAQRSRSRCTATRGPTASATTTRRPRRCSRRSAARRCAARSPRRSGRLAGRRAARVERDGGAAARPHAAQRQRRVARDRAAGAAVLRPPCAGGARRPPPRRRHRLAAADFDAVAAHPRRSNDRAAAVGLGERAAGRGRALVHAGPPPLGRAAPPGRIAPRALRPRDPTRRRRGDGAWSGGDPLAAQNGSVALAHGGRYSVRVRAYAVGHEARRAPRRRRVGGRRPPRRVARDGSRGGRAADGRPHRRRRRRQRDGLLPHGRGGRELQMGRRRRRADDARPRRRRRHPPRLRRRTRRCRWRRRPPLGAAAARDVGHAAGAPRQRLRYEYYSLALGGVRPAAVPLGGGRLRVALTVGASASLRASIRDGHGRRTVVCK